jgi:AcrR family transcriptional regulator
MDQPATVKARKSASQQRAKVTVDVLLDATARILTQHGYAKTTTNRIAVMAGVSIGSLYQYFPNKEALVAALVTRHNQQMLDLLHAAMLRCTFDDLTDAMRELIRGMLAAHRVNPQLHRIFKEEVPRFGPLEDVEDIRKQVLALALQSLRNCQDDVAIADLETAAFICVTTVEALTHAVITGDRCLSATDEDNYVEHMTRLVAGYLSVSPFPASSILRHHPSGVKEPPLQN